MTTLRTLFGLASLGLISCRVMAAGPIETVNQCIGRFLSNQETHTAREAYRKRNGNGMFLSEYAKKAEIRTEDQRIAAWWALLLERAWNASEGPRAGVATGADEDLVALGRRARQAMGTSARERVMFDWWRAAAGSMPSPGDPSASEYLRKVEYIQGPNGPEPVYHYGLTDQQKAEQRAAREKWQASTARVDTILLFRIYNPGDRPVGDADLAWLAGSDSPFRPVAIAELRVREGRSRRTGPWTPRWNAWAAQNRGVLRELLVRRVQRLLAPAPAGQPARTSSLPG